MLLANLALFYLLQSFLFFSFPQERIEFVKEFLKVTVSGLLEFVFSALVWFSFCLFVFPYIQSTTVDYHCSYALTMYVTVHIFDCFVHLDKQTLIDKFGCNVKARVGKINKASDVSEHEH